MTQEKISLEDGNKAISRYMRNSTVQSYEDDWNALMEVVDKIDDDVDAPYIEICGRRCEISYMINHNWPRDKEVLCNYNASNTESKKEAIWRALAHYCNSI